MRACPTPRKRAFRDEASANTKIESARDAGGDDLEAYLCPCGEWHLRNRVRYRGKNDYHAKQRRRAAELAEKRARERAALGLDLDDVVDTIMEALGFTTDD